MLRRITLASSAALLAAALVAAPASAHGPTCADSPLGISVHGQHVVRDYVIGGSMSWPPAGSVGSSIAGRGAYTPGGPGPGFHFLADPPFAPGASFCNSQSKSPGLHL